MAISVNKIAPSAVAIAFVGFCIWPSVSALTSTPKPPPQQKKSAELANSLLTCKLGPPPTKNPWGGKDAASLAKQKNAASEATSVAAAAIETSSGNRATLLADVRLDATCIFGDRRMAVINGRLYSVRETIAAATPGGPSYKLLSVFPHTVLLQSGSRVVELAYSNVVGRPSTSPKPATNEKEEAGMQTARRSLTWRQPDQRRRGGTC